MIHKQLLIHALAHMQIMQTIPSVIGYSLVSEGAKIGKHLYVLLQLKSN